MGRPFSSWRPELRCPGVRAVPWHALRAEGVEAAVFDLDNTLCPWGAGELPPDAVALLAELGRLGLARGVLTNSRLRGRRAAIEGALGALGVALEFNAGKPGKRGYIRLLGALGVAPGPRVVAVGDQWWTDVIGAKRMGLRAVLVPPLDPASEPAWARWRRRSERWILGPGEAG